MSSLTWDSNAWYAVQNFGSDWFVAAGSTNGSDGSITVAGSDTTNAALWQIGTSDNGSHYIRPKQYGSGYCIVTDGDNLSLSQCTASSSVWNIAYWSGNDASDGYSLTSSTTGTGRRLYVNNDGNNISMALYPTSNSNDDIFYEWDVRSVSAINDQSFSTFLSSSSGSTTTSVTSSTTSVSNTTTSSSSAPTTITSSSGSTSESSSQSLSSSPAPEPSTSTNIVTVTGSGSSAPSTGGSNPTNSASTVVVTNTPSNPSSSSTISPSVSLNGADTVQPRTKAVIWALALGLGTFLCNSLVGVGS